MPDCACDLDEAAKLERRTLWTLLAINAVMFVVEVVAGWWGDSAGLVADSLDMLADASVYGIVLVAVGRSRRRQANAATASGVLEIALGLMVLVEVVHRVLSGSEPSSGLMMAVGAVALAANVTCLMLIAKHRTGGVHMRASWIFSTNDVIANLGLILSGVLVKYLGSRLPDLLIGALVSVVVVRGGVQILREAQETRGKNNATVSSPH